MTGYYDLVLGLIPLALGGITALLSVFGLALTTAIPVASVVAVGLIGHAMFVNGPVDSTPGSAAADDTAFQPAD
jgi:L-alanine-DL-glutamate epimerase-like enolase superfamily enzyme